AAARAPRLSAAAPIPTPGPWCPASGGRRGRFSRWVPARLAVRDQRPGECLDGLVLDGVALREMCLRGAELRLGGVDLPLRVDVGAVHAREAIETILHEVRVLTLARGRLARSGRAAGPTAGRRKIVAEIKKFRAAAASDGS